MRKTYIDKTDGWRWRFALFPFRLDNGPNRTWVWLEWYQSRSGGYFTEIRLAEGASGLPVGTLPVAKPCGPGGCKSPGHPTKPLS